MSKITIGDLNRDAVSNLTHKEVAHIVGGAIRGGAGNDVLIGGRGNDVLLSQDDVFQLTVEWGDGSASVC